MSQLLISDYLKQLDLIKKVSGSQREIIQRGAHRGLVADVEAGRVHRVAEFGAQRVEAIGAAAGGDDLPAGIDEAARGGATETGGSAGDQGGAWGEIVHAAILGGTSHQMPGNSRLVSPA